MNMGLDKISWTEAKSVDDFIQQIIPIAIRGQNVPMTVFLNRLQLSDLRVKISTRLTVHEINDLNKISLIGLNSFDDLLDNLKNLYFEPCPKAIAVCNWFCYDKSPEIQLHRANELLWRLHNICDFTKMRAYVRLAPQEHRDGNSFWDENLDFPEYPQFKIITSRYTYLASSAASSPLESSSSPPAPFWPN